MATEAMYWTGQPRLETDGGGGWDLLCAGPVALQHVWEARNQSGLRQCLSQSRAMRESVEYHFPPGLLDILDDHPQDFTS